MSSMRTAPATGPATGTADLRAFTWPLAACGAIALPALLAYNLPPSATFFNQAMALFGWGVWLFVLAAALPGRTLAWSPGLRALLLALALLLLAALASAVWAGQPWALSLSAAGLIAAAAVTALVGAALQQAGLGAPAFRAFCVGLLVAGVASSAIGLVQVYAPQWADGNWLARSVTEGRAVGNLRQPNHLCSLLLWGVVATAWLCELRVLKRGVLAAALALLLMFAVVLSASRSGVVGAVLLALWGLLDRRLPGRLRVALLLAPLVYALLWAGATAWAHHSQQVFGGETRFSGAGDISSSRFGIWANTLALVRAHPWLGVGFGEFNFAWTLTPFPGRPVAFFDHAHNLPLHLAAELGVPLAALVLALLGWALWCAWRAGRAEPTETTKVTMATEGAKAASLFSHLRAAFVMVLMVLLHSLLEYPLWYAYFLLPAAFVLGLGLGGPPAMATATATATPAPASATSAAAARTASTRPLLLAAMLMMLGAVVSVRDYLRVVVIFAPPENAAPLEDRIADGQRSWFFSHHGDYAAVTTAQSAAQAATGLAGAPHYLLDARLMMAWAKALHDAGDEQRARYVAQRLKEFRNVQAQEFFEACEPAAVAALPAGTPLPFQCLASEAVLDYRDFR
jgi:O-antigen ligase